MNFVTFSKFRIFREIRNFENLYRKFKFSEIEIQKLIVTLLCMEEGGIDSTSHQVVDVPNEVNHALHNSLRPSVVPVGSHEVVLFCESPRWRSGLSFSFIACILCCIILLFCVCLLLCSCTSQYNFSILILLSGSLLLF